MTATRSEHREERRADVLRSAVRSFIASGEPVSSRAIAAESTLGLSSASIRMVLAELEDLGYLMQPHTSAGRVPTEKAYRLYASLLVGELRREGRLESASGGELLPAELVGSTTDVTALLSEASRALARQCGWVGLVLHPRIANTRFLIARFLRLDRARVVAVVVGEEGVVADRVVQVDAEYSQDELDRISNFVTNRFRGSTLSEVRRTLERELGEERAARDAALRRSLAFALEAIGRCEAGAEVYVEAPAAELGPAVENLERLRQLVRAYGEKDRVAALLARCLDRDGVQVLIGGEGEREAGYEGFPGLAVVAVRYGDADRPLGTVGVLGSTRMHYEQIIPLVDRVAKDVAAALTVGRSSQT